MRDPEPAAASSRPGDAGAPWRQPVRGGHPDPILAAAPGLEFLRAMLTGETPASPLSRLTGMHPVELTAELVRFALPLSRWLCGEDGTVPLGVLAIPADAAMACAIIAELPAGSAITTSELGIRQVRPVRPGGMLLCTGTVLDLGPPVALAEVTITDDSGALVARGGSLCVVLPFTAEGGPAAGRPEQSPEPADPDPDPDPWERSVPDASLSRLTGLTMIAVAPGEAAFALPATRWLCAPRPGACRAVPWRCSPAPPWTPPCRAPPRPGAASSRWSSSSTTFDRWPATGARPPLMRR